MLYLQKKKEKLQFCLNNLFLKKEKYVGRNPTAHKLCKVSLGRNGGSLNNI